MDNEKQEVQKKLEEKIQNSINKREDLSAENIKIAEQLGFKNHPDKIINTDQYGFVKDKK
jgi:hypothetical protein